MHQHQQKSRAGRARPSLSSCGSQRAVSSTPARPLDLPVIFEPIGVVATRSKIKTPDEDGAVALFGPQPSQRLHGNIRGRGLGRSWSRHPIDVDDALV